MFPHRSKSARSALQAVLRTGAVLTAFVAVAGFLDLSRPARGQQADSSKVGADSGATSAACPVYPVPFGPGERFLYNVRVGIMGGRGNAIMEVAGVDTVRGIPAYHLRLDVHGGALIAKVDDRLESWLGVRDLVAHRINQDQHEVRYERHRTLDFFPAERLWKQVGGNKQGELASNCPLDEVAFLYLARTLPLEVGRTWTFDRYFQQGGNPVVLTVLRRERVKVPAGTFNTIVVRPVFQTKGLFGRGGQAELYLTDDARRIPVLLRSKLPILGYLDLLLAAQTPGVALVEMAPQPAASARPVPAQSAADSAGNGGASGVATPGGAAR